jgi:hypothetical protein
LTGRWFIEVRVFSFVHYICFLFLIAWAIIKIIPTKINVDVKPEPTHFNIQKTEASLAIGKEIIPSTKY